MPIDTLIHLKRRRAALLLLAVPTLLAACAVVPGRDALRVGVAGIDAAEGEGLELRLIVKLRLQNPNETAVAYDGAALDFEVDGRTLATGVTSASGSVPRYGEAVLAVPMTISAFNAIRQALVLADGRQRDSLPYLLRGKLSGGVFGTVRFTEQGELSWASIGRRN